MKGIVIAAFPGVGKSHYTNNNANCSDSDSSLFSWSEPGVRHPEFPNNYITHIKEMIKENDYVFVSSHQVVREALVKEGIKFYLVYPSKTLKDSYIQRYKERGSDEKFISLLENNFESWFDDCYSQKDCEHVILASDIFMDTVISGIEQGEI